MTFVEDAARHMRDANVGSLLVVNDDRLLGIVTDRDLVVRALAGGRPAQTTVEMVMSAPAVTVPADADVATAAEAMVRHRVRRLPVVDGDRVAGIVTLDDLLSSAVIPLEDLPQLVEVACENPAPFSVP
jgi:CBS domain-containing protein